MTRKPSSSIIQFTMRLQRFGCGTLAAAMLLGALNTPQNAYAGTCVATRACIATICIYLAPQEGPHALGDPCSPLTLTGTGVADVQGQSMTWQSLELTGSSPALGNMQLRLNPAVTSTGYLVDPTFPTLNHIDFFFQLDTEVYGQPLISSQPVRLEATVGSLPPRASYALLSPVDFHFTNAPQTPILQLASAHVNVSPPPPVPTVSTFAFLILAACLVIAASLAVRRASSWG